MISKNKNLIKNGLLTTMIFAALFLTGCGADMGSIGQLTLDVEYETDDSGLDLNKVPSTATDPEEGYHTNVPRGQDLSLKATEGSPIKVVSWEIKDHFGSKTIKQIDSAGEFKITVNHQIVAHIVCVDSSVCSGDYVCSDNACVSASN